jgi:hypothetical protein
MTVAGLYVKVKVVFVSIEARRGWAGLGWVGLARDEVELTSGAKIGLRDLS